MDEDVSTASRQDIGTDGESKVVRGLRQRLNDALLRISQLDTRNVSPHIPAGASGSAQPGESWNTRPLSLPRDTVAGATLHQAISAMESRVSVWDGSHMRLIAHTLQTQGKTPLQGGCFTVDSATMLAASHAIEDVVMSSRLECELYVGFQRMSLFRPQIRRYVYLLDSARYIYIFGVDDVPPGAPIFRHPKLIRFVITPQVGAGLLWFWFVLVSHPSFSTVLLAQQTSGELFQRRLGVRTYHGFWSFDPYVAREIMDILRDVGRSLYFGPSL